MVAAFAVLWPLTVNQIATEYQKAISAVRQRQVAVSKNHWQVAGLWSGGSLKVSGFTNDEKVCLTLDSMRLANNQINEACNKLYATVELANAAQKRMDKEGIASDRFSGEFILGALVPVLYYSQVAALLSLLSSYGILFMRDRRVKAERKKDHNLISLKWQQEYEFLIIRTQNDWNVLSRTQEGNSDGWHKQLVRIGERFLASGTHATGFDLDLVMQLKTQRELVDYSVLGETSVGNVIGFRNYLGFLPKAHANIRYCISTIQRISGITNNCDSRLANLERTELNALLQQNP